MKASIRASSRASLKSAAVVEAARSSAKRTVVPSAGHRPSDQANAPVPENRQVERAAVGTPDELERDLAARRLEAGHRVDGLVEDADGVEPPHDVASPVEPGQPGVAPDRQRDRPSRSVDLVGELDPARRGADDQHAAGGELVGVAVVGRRQLVDAAGELAAEARNSRPAAVAGGHDHVRRGPGPAIGGDPVSPAANLDGENRGFELDRSRERARVALQEVDHLGHRHVAVRVGPPVFPPGQAALPVRGEQAQRVPALGAPALGDPSPLEDDVVDRPVAEDTAHRQPGLAAADDDHARALHARHPSARALRAAGPSTGPAARDGSAVRRPRP